MLALQSYTGEERRNLLLEARSGPARRRFFARVSLGVALRDVARDPGGAVAAVAGKPDRHRRRPPPRRRQFDAGAVAAAPGRRGFRDRATAAGGGARRGFPARATAPAEGSGPRAPHPPCHARPAAAMDADRAAVARDRGAARG